MICYTGAMRVFLFLAALFAFIPLARAEYNYAHINGEYVFSLPEAPRVETIWSWDKKIPYIPSAPTDSDAVLGERAIFQRRDLEGRYFIRLMATTVKADKDFLESLTRERIQMILADEFIGKDLRNKRFSYSQGNETLKWGTARATSTEGGRRIFNTAHFLSGLNSLTVIKIEYTPDEGIYDDYFKMIDSSIDLIRN